MNAHCPTCGYPLHRDNHPAVGLVRFCRSACVGRWFATHGHASTEIADVLPDGVERRAA